MGVKLVSRSGPSRFVAFAVVLVITAGLVGLAAVIGSNPTAGGCRGQTPDCPVRILSAQNSGLSPPAGPVIRITVENIGSSPVVNLTIVLLVHSSHVFAFENISSSAPLVPGSTASESFTLVGDGYVSNSTFQAVVTGSMQDRSQFNYTTYVTLP